MRVKISGANTANAAQRRFPTNLVQKPSEGAGILICKTVQTHVKITRIQAQTLPRYPERLPDSPQRYQGKSAGHCPPGQSFLRMRFEFGAISMSLFVDVVTVGCLCRNRLCLETIAYEYLPLVMHQTEAKEGVENAQ